MNRLTILILSIWTLLMVFFVFDSYLGYKEVTKEIEQPQSNNKLDIILSDSTHSVVSRAFCGNAQELVRLYQLEHKLMLKNITVNVSPELDEVRDEIDRTQYTLDQDIKYLKRHNFGVLTEDECKYIFRSY